MFNRKLGEYLGKPPAAPQHIPSQPLVGHITDLLQTPLAKKTISIFH
jgi:hypothetical protein